MLRDITDAGGKWWLKGDVLTNRTTGKLRIVKGIPHNLHLINMHERTFVRLCKQAFESGVWPTQAGK